MNFDLKLIIDSFLENKIRVKNVVALASENRQDKTTPLLKVKLHSFIYFSGACDVRIQAANPNKPG